MSEWIDKMSAATDAYVEKEKLTAEQAQLEMAAQTAPMTFGRPMAEVSDDQIDEYVETVRTVYRRARSAAIKTAGPSGACMVDPSGFAIGTWRNERSRSFAIQAYPAALILSLSWTQWQPMVARIGLTIQGRRKGGADASLHLGLFTVTISIAWKERLFA